jgi:hypothetical protein
MAAALILTTLACLTPTAAEDAAAPQAFDSPEAAAKALLDAAKRNDDKALRAMFGGVADQLMRDSSDPIVRKERAEAVAAAEKHWAIEKTEEGTATLVIGTNLWPFPVPIVPKDGKWQFDAKAGLAEILARRVGANELAAIETCKVYADAQVAYASKDRDGDGVREYAQRIVSTAGKQDGLFWKAAEGQEQSPLGAFVAEWEPHLVQGVPLASFRGYKWRVLTGQGPAAPGGRHSYVINGNMIAGFALVGWPAEYRNTGVMTFLVSNHGKIFERDLGPETEAAVAAMLGFNPEEGWDEAEGE